ncbi:hypothetical protein BB561_005120 [Smittium simulii]|uniref:Uncharacterized protein n=1 Tax=Smittium simulii TaxID=133385 RepID=A0A2T9YC31_9FUNG|nr:hypothetical protein BB561_005120 [Smittium simulii]
MIRLRQELSLTDLNIKTAVARARVFGKWSGLRTWISDLIKCPYKNRSDTWTKLKTHTNNVFKIRNGTYWKARRYAKSGFIEKKFIEEYPFCIIIVGKYSKNTASAACFSLNEIFDRLLREKLKLSSTRIRKDPTVLYVKTTLATAKFLNAISLPRYLMLNKVRLLLIYAASNTTQQRRELVYKIMGLPEKGPKLSERTIYSLIEPQKVDTVVETKKKKQKKPRPKNILAQQPHLQTSMHLKSKNFMQEGRTRVLSRTIKYTPSRRTSLYVLSPSYAPKFLCDHEFGGALVDTGAKKLNPFKIDLPASPPFLLFSSLTTNPHSYKRKLTKETSTEYQRKV